MAAAAERGCAVTELAAHIGIAPAPATGGRQARRPPTTYNAPTWPEVPADNTPTMRIVIAQQQATEAPARANRPTDAEDAANRRLAELAAAGDVDAFGLIYDRFVNKVGAFIYYQTSDKLLTEDLTSETFTRALARIASFRWQGRDALGGWLVTIARNLVRDHLKSAWRRRVRPTSFDGDGDGDDRCVEPVDDDPEHDPERAWITHVDNVHLLRALWQLKPEQRECLTLRYVNNFSVPATAAIMGMRPGAVKALTYRAAGALSRLLPAEYAEGRTPVRSSVNRRPLVADPLPDRGPHR